MILILSEETDHSTNEVIDWISYYNKKFVRLNHTDRIETIQITENFDTIIHFDSKEINTKDITSYWYRRGFVNMAVDPIDKKEFPFFQVFEKHKAKEVKVLNQQLHRNLNQVKTKIGDYYNTDTNKLHVLNTAKKIGLTIPNTIITTVKTDLEKFLKTHGKAITKPISEVIFSTNENLKLISYTKRIDEGTLSQIDDTFFASLFQKEIHKKYELRIFYLHKKCFSMAIFSQLDQQTTIDFREYNNEIPNRNVPFTLPDKIAEKLISLMEQLRYESGSIDMIVDKENKFYFLEVNPIGQFGMVSEPCNFNLEQEIARNLCSVFLERYER